MPIAKKIFNFFSKPFFQDYRTIFLLWISIPVFLGVFSTLTGRLHNNYKIYKYVFFNTLEQFPLFQPRPEFFIDVNHYGPIFGMVIAPFAVLPDVLGVTLWLVMLSLVLFYAIKELPVSRLQHMAIFWICTNSLLIAQTNVQFNIATAALIILSYTNIRKEKDIWAAFMIMLGVFVKIYGIVGFAFFFYSKHKYKLLLWSVLWGIIFFILPMIISSPEFIITQYKEWFNALITKSQVNDNALYQNISFLGMVRKTTGLMSLSNLPMILGGVILFALPYLRIREYMQPGFQLHTLASVLIFVVLFSTGSEPNSYIIAITGVAVWFVIQPRPFTKWNLFLIVFGIAVSSFAPSDLFPRSFYYHFVLPNALQALPCTIIWLSITYEMLFRNSEKYVTDM